MNTAETLSKQQDVLKVDMFDLRRAAGRYVTGVSVITATSGEGAPVGATVNAITCLSLNPPLYLACLGNASNTLKAVKEGGHFGINVLSRDQGEHAKVFASKSSDKFANVPYETGCTGAPLLKECVARFECEVESLYAGGDHTILVGRVVDLWECDEAPLVMRSGQIVDLAAASGVSL